MVTLSLKLCNSNRLDRRCTEQKLIRSLKILKTCKVSSRRAIWKVVWMEGPLHSHILRWNCLLAFVCWLVDCSSWPNLTAACAAQVAKRGDLSSLWHGYTFWRARCRFRTRGLVTILVHLYLYNLDMILYTSQLFQNKKIPALLLCQYSTLFILFLPINQCYQKGRVLKLRIQRSRALLVPHIQMKYRNRCGCLGPYGTPFPPEWYTVQPGYMCLLILVHFMSV